MTFLPEAVLFVLYRDLFFNRFFYRWYCSKNGKQFFYAVSWLYFRQHRHLLTQCFIGIVLFPVWHNLKKYAVIYRSLEGINAAIVGIMLGAVLFLMNAVVFAHFETSKVTGIIDVLVFTITYLLLRYTKVKAPFIVMGCLLLGFLL